MADALRKSVIELDWKMNTSELQKANDETDRLINKTSQISSAFGGSKSAVNNAAKSVSNYNDTVQKGSSNVVQMGQRTQSAFKNTTAAVGASSTAINNYGTSGSSSLKTVGAAANSTRGNIAAVSSSVNSAIGSTNRFAQIGSSALSKVKTSAKNLQRGLESVNNAATKASDTVWTGFNKAKNAVMATSVVLVGAGKKAFDYASDTNEAFNKVEVAFGNDSKIVEEWSKGTLKNIGLARGTALDLAAGYGDMSTSMGIGTKEAAKMSSSMVSLAGDMASFKNIGIERVNTALNGVFTGETEALKGLGIVMTQANLEQYALSTGALSTAENHLTAAKNSMAREKAQAALNKAVEKHGAGSLEARSAQLKLTEAEEKGNETATAALNTLSQAELVRLRYNYVMDKTKNSQGDFARTSDQAANASRVFSETLKETASNMGQKLLPLFTPLIIKASEFVKQGENIPAMLEKFGKYAEPSAKKLVKSFGEAKDYFVDEVIPTAIEVGKAIGPGISEGAKETAKFVGTMINDYIKPGIKALKDFAEEHPSAMKSIVKWSTVGIAGLLAFRFVKKPLKSAKGKVVDLITAISKIGSTAITQAAQAKIAFKSMKRSAQDAVIAENNNSLLNGADELMVQRSKVKTPSKVATGLKWFAGGSPSLGAVATPVAQHAGKMSLGAKAVGVVSKVGKVAKTAKAVPGLSYLAAGASLIGINDKNKGERLGNATGSIIGGLIGSKAAAIAGAKFGALAGTAFGPIGTAVGGIAGTAIGAAAGTWIGKTIQKKWPEIKKIAGNLWNGYKKIPIYGQIAQAFEYGAKEGIKLGKKAIDGAVGLKDSIVDFFAKPLKDSGKISSGKGVSKDTAKKVNSYMGESEKVISSSVKLSVTGKPMSDAELNAVKKSIDKMEDEVISSLNAKRDKSVKNIDRLIQLGAIDDTTADSAKRASNELADVRTRQFKESSQKLKDLTEKENNEVLESRKQFEDRNNKIREKARQENRDLTKKEQDEIRNNETIAQAATQTVTKKYADEKKKLNEDMKKDAVIALSDSAKEQKIILGNLQESSSEISAKQAADVVAQSYKAKEGSVKSANEKYEETKKILDEERFVSGTISDAKYKELLGNAKKERDESITVATEMHDGVVDQAKKQATGHVEQVNWETGETLSKWDIFKKDSSAKFTEIKDGSMEIWNKFSSGFGSAMGSAVKWGLDTWDGFVTDFAGNVNNVIGGINAIFDFFGIKQLKTWTPTKGARSNADQYQQGKGGKMFSSGSRGASYSGTALTGEEGIELAYNKSTSQMRILGQNGPEITQVSSGERILNHTDTKAVLSGGMGVGTTLPGFANGKGNGIGEFTSSVLDGAKDMGTAAWDKTKEVSKNIADATVEKIQSAKEWLANPVEKVKALVTKHNRFKKESKIGGIGFGTMDKIATSGAEWVKNKLAEFKNFFASEDGESSGSGAYAPHFGSPFIRTSGYGNRDALFGRSFHNGIDYAAPTGTPLPAQYPGTVSYASGAPSYGNLVRIQVAKGLETFYGHMNSINAKTGSQVKAGEIIGTVGSTGDSTGAHVHYELQKDGKHVNPDTYGQSASSSPSGTGAERWRGTITKALQMNGLPTDATYTNAWLRQVQSESGGNEKAVQGGYTDVNTLSGDLAKGLLQTISATFNAYKHSGFGDIFKGLDNSLAAINYAKNRYGASGMLGVIGKGHGYAKGGRPSKGETVLVGENGPELFEADTAGTVHSHDKTKGLFNQSMPAINYSPTINVEIKGDADKSVIGSIEDTIRKVLDAEYSKLLDILGTGGVV